MRPFVLGAVASLVLSRGVLAACPGPEDVTRYLEDFRAARLSAGFGVDTLDDARCAKRKLVRELPAVLGAVVGYKAGFTNEAAQRRVGLDAPVWGTMFGAALRENGASVDARSGARLMFEPDLVFVVKDAALARATTRLEALSHLEAVVPFVELPDLMMPEPDGVAIVSVNVGFRAGVLGPRVPIEATDAFLDALATMDVVMSAGPKHRELARAKGDLPMGHPVEAALWLARALAADGIALRPGDLLSVGAYAAPAPVEAGTEITVAYLGLPGDPEVAVRFE